MPEPTPRKPLSRFGRVSIALIALAIAAHGAFAIWTQHYTGKTRRGDLVESTGMVAVGMGFFFVGASLLMVSLVLPNRLRLPSIVLGTITMVGGVAATLFLR